MKKTILILNLIFAIVACVGGVFFIIDKTLLPKTIASASYVIMGGLNLFYVIKNKSSNRRYGIVMLVGLIFALLGDIILEIEFLIGAIFFAIGHVFFFFSYTCLVPFKWKNLIFSAAFFVPVVLFITLAPIFTFPDIVMEIMCIVYALVISCMTGKAIANYVQIKNPLNLFIMIGSLLFLFSDFMLLLSRFASLPVAFVFCICTYYPAEILLAFSIFKSAKGK